MPAVYELETQYNLNLSMFERLVKLDLDYSTLQIQRRMSVEISDLTKL
jgi:hypothetical protein